MPAVRFKSSVSLSRSLYQPSHSASENKVMHLRSSISSIGKYVKVATLQRNYRSTGLYPVGTEPSYIEVLLEPGIAEVTAISPDVVRST